MHTIQARNGHRHHLTMALLILPHPIVKVEVDGQDSINSIIVSPPIRQHTAKTFIPLNKVLQVSITLMASKVRTLPGHRTFSLLIRPILTEVATGVIVAITITRQPIEGILVLDHHPLLVDLELLVLREAGEAIFRTCNGLPTMRSPRKMAETHRHPRTSNHRPIRNFDPKLVMMMRTTILFDHPKTYRFKMKARVKRKCHLHQKTSLMLQRETKLNSLSSPSLQRQPSLHQISHRR